MTGADEWSFDCCESFEMRELVWTECGKLLSRHCVTTPIMKP